MTRGEARLECARLTARGEAGIAIFRLRGEEAGPVLARIFKPRGGAPLLPSQIRVGCVVDGDSVLDDAVVRTRTGPAGFEAELSIHGSVFVADRVEALLRAEGAEPLAEDEAWELGPTVGVDAGDRIVAEARQALLESFSELQTAFFLGAIGGNLSLAVRSIETSIRALPPAAPVAPILERLGALFRRASFGQAMANPPAVLVSGIPNAGKSTLFNALLGESRAIVSPEPGTTRDVVAEPLVIAGFPFRLADSAGIRASSDLVERLGVARARRAAVAADIVVVLVDPEANLEEQATLAGGIVTRRIVVVSKSDLPAAALVASDSRVAALRPGVVSARTGAGIPEVRSRILAASAFGQVADVRQAAPFLARHRDLLAASHDTLREGRSRDGAARALASLYAAAEP